MRSFDEPNESITGPRTAWIYCGLFALLCGAAYLVLRQSGVVEPLSGAAPSHDGNVLPRVLVALATITVVARGTGEIAARVFGQPPVIGEIVAGLLLGPSALGAAWPAAQAFLVPAPAMPHLGILAKIGVVLFMFLVGLELDVGLFRSNAKRTVAIAHASMVVPFVLGALLAFVLHPIYSTAAVPFPLFAAFVGVSLSVTAFPVLVRILADRGLSSTPLGRTAIACAALDDVTAWCLLALVSGVATAEIAHAGRVFGFAALYLVTMQLVVRPFLARFAARVEARDEPIGTGELAFVFGALLLSAAATDAIGIHALFGAFFFGALLPHGGKLARELEARLRDLVVVLLLPVFFAFSGMRTEIGLISSGRDVGFCVLVIALASAGKLGGTFVAARLLGHERREAAALGILMNTRGLMELIVLNVGLDLGVLSRRLFTILVIMAIVTTLATSPLLGLVLRDRQAAKALTHPA